MTTPEVRADMPAVNSRVAHQLRRFAVAGLAAGLLFVLELALLAGFSNLRTNLLKDLTGRDAGANVELLALLVTPIILIAAMVSLRRRLFSSNVWLMVAIAAILTGGLGAIAWLPGMPDLTDSSQGLDWFFLVTLALGAPAAAIAGVATLTRWRRWGLAAGYFALAPIYAYLALDDRSLDRTVTVEEIAPSFPGAEASYEVLMRFGPNHPQGRESVAISSRQMIWKNMKVDMANDPAQPEKFVRFLSTQREAIATDWADLDPVRTWWNELNAFERIADLTPSGAAYESLPFQPVRSYTQLACAVAGLQALDGQGDAAFGTLQPVLDVTLKLEPSSRTLVRSMISQVSLKRVLSAATFILDHAEVSGAARGRFAAALASASGGEGGARRLILIECTRTMSMLEQAPDLALSANQAVTPANRPLFHVFRTVSGLVYNPRRTSNAYGQLVAELAAMAARREFKQMNQRREDFFSQEGIPGFKNFLGGLFLKEATPAFEKVAESYWSTEDARTALLARLSRTP